ncbi:hypothetical protein HKO22_06945 [Peptoniphilus sp. AGMB00490]|uniref:Uncharacterized protein n=1 Tax=Peptoniphilus faecalis TaxID=2731255 RepID=A0A848R844_9FIRM|nr:hypothetical protein [Peptoniphilus faecalis]NMW85467.1 hypothetical protein [Peptoniphilus faecalis]
MKRIECYETEDGRLFTTYEEALIHEKEEEIKNNLGALLNTCISVNSLMKSYVGDNKLCANYEEARTLKIFLIKYMTEIMLEEFTAFKSLFDGGLKCK